MSSFNANVIVSEQMEVLMSAAAQELAMRAVYACADQYKFDASEAIRFLGLNEVKVSRKQAEKSSKAAKIEAVKASFPLPYSGECNDALCHGLRQNNSLFTQCQVQRKGENQFCKSCQSSADNNSGIPEYGTIEQRQAVGILEYVDPKGRKPIAYTKIMKKFKVSQEQVLEEAGKMSMNIDAIHFAEQEQDGKRGRPKAEKAPKEPKGAKGRPKKTKKVLEIEGDEEDLFASLVASANSDDSESEEDEEIVVKPVKKVGKSDEEREAERIAKEEQRLAEKAGKEAQRLKEKAEKEAKLAAEKEAKEAKIAAEKEAKAAKEAQRLKEKDEKEAKLAAEKEAKSTKSKKPAAKLEVEVEAADEEPDVVKKIEVDGKKYLKSKKTGIIYDYKEYTTNGEQVVVGKWNESKNKIDFAASVEESEEEYEEEEEEA